MGNKGSRSSRAGPDQDYNEYRRKPRWKQCVSGARAAPLLDVDSSSTECDPDLESNATTKNTPQDEGRLGSNSVDDEGHGGNVLGPKLLSGRGLMQAGRGLARSGSNLVKQSASPLLKLASDSVPLVAVAEADEHAHNDEQAEADEPEENTKLHKIKSTLRKITCCALKIHGELQLFLRSLQAEEGESEARKKLRKIKCWALKILGGLYLFLFVVFLIIWFFPTLPSLMNVVVGVMMSQVVQYVLLLMILLPCFLVFVKKIVELPAYIQQKLWEIPPLILPMIETMLMKLLLEMEHRIMEKLTNLPRDVVQASMKGLGGVKDLGKGVGSKLRIPRRRSHSEPPLSRSNTTPDPQIP